MILQGIAPSQGEGLPLLNCSLPLKIDSRLALLVEVGFQFGEVLVSGRDRQSKMQHHETKQPNSSNKLLLFWRLLVCTLAGYWAFNVITCICAASDQHRVQGASRIPSNIQWWHGLVTRHNRHFSCCPTQQCTSAMHTCSI